MWASTVGLVTLVDLSGVMDPIPIYQVGKDSMCITPTPTMLVGSPTTQYHFMWLE